MVHNCAVKRALLIPLMGVATAVLPSCSSSLNQPLDGDYNPLDSPGRRGGLRTVDAGPKYAPGTWVEVTDPNAMFYRKYPKGDAQPDSALTVGTPLKVIGGQGSYVKIETEGGQIGYVPAIMVGDKASGSEIPIVPGGGSAPPAYIDPVDPGGPGEFKLPSGGPQPLPDGGGGGFVAPEPEVPPISVEESPKPSGPSVPPDPVAE